MKARRVKKLEPDAPLAQNVARIVRVRVDELLQFVPPALQRDNAEEQHDMRIAAKRLRYILELTGFCLGAVGERGRKSARELQGALGELHDCDVMLPRVEQRLASLRAADAAAVRRRAGTAPDVDIRLLRAAPNRTAYRGLEVLFVYLQARRELLFDRFTELWERQQKAGTWEKLAAAAERDLEHEHQRAEAARRKGEVAPEAERETREQAARATAWLREARE